MNETIWNAHMHIMDGIAFGTENVEYSKEIAK